MPSDLHFAEPWLLSIRNSETNKAREKSKRFSYNMTEPFLYPISEEPSQNMLVEEVPEPKSKSLTDKQLLFILYFYLDL